MKFFKQDVPRICNIITIQQIFSFYNQYPGFNEIKKELPYHAFGNWITEIGIYFENKGFKTKLISNTDKLIPDCPAFSKSLEEYKKLGKFENRFIKESDIKNKPIIINVDRNKIFRKEKYLAPHYVVAAKEKDFYWLYDGYNFSRKVKRNFEDLLKFSLDINRYHRNGMWLVLE